MFPIDNIVYGRASRDIHEPIFFAGSFDAPFCIIGRDLGVDEVLNGAPQVGAAGHLVRSGLYRAATGKEPPAFDRFLEPGLKLALLTNLVPYKPVGNVAFRKTVRERFRPFLEELLLEHWTGRTAITLGTEAFRWFSPYVPPGTLEAIWERDDRYEVDLPVELKAVVGGRTRHRSLIVAPLPHPSPLNQRWYKFFPDLLVKRLKA